MNFDIKWKICLLKDVLEFINWVKNKGWFFCGIDIFLWLFFWGLFLLLLIYVLDICNYKVLLILLNVYLFFIIVSIF